MLLNSDMMKGIFYQVDGLSVDLNAWQCCTEKHTEMDYHDYSSIDFVLNDDFFLWVIHPAPRSERFWNDWLSQYLHKRKEAEEARRCILQFSAQINRTEVQAMPQKEALWKRIEVMIQREINL